MDQPIRTESYHDYTISIYRDEYPESPREWDNLGTMYFFHRRYVLGDKHNLGMEEVHRLANGPQNESLPVYMYDHSGYTIATTPFSCPWDSGQLGHIVVTDVEMRKEFGVKRLTKELRAKALKQLQQEVETYDEYLRGEVYGYVAEDEGGNHLDSCWGYYGSDDEYMMSEARNAVDYQITKAAKDIERQIKDEPLELQFA